jgi:hypothetical protein
MSIMPVADEPRINVFLSGKVPVPQLRRPAKVFTGKFLQCTYGKIGAERFVTTDVSSAYFFLLCKAESHAHRPEVILSAKRSDACDR